MTRWTPEGTVWQRTLKVPRMLCSIKLQGAAPGAPQILSAAALQVLQSHSLRRLFLCVLSVKVTRSSEVKVLRESVGIKAVTIMAFVSAVEVLIECRLSLRTQRCDVRLMFAVWKQQRKTFGSEIQDVDSSLLSRLESPLTWAPNLSWICFFRSSVIKQSKPRTGTGLLVLSRSTFILKNYHLIHLLFF